MALPTYSSATVLLVIDTQLAFNDPAWGQRNNPEAESNIAALLGEWRATRRPVIHIRHLNEDTGYRFSADAPGYQAKAEAKEIGSEPVLTKTVNSSFIGTDLEERLRAFPEPHVVVVGLTTDHCVSTTVRMGSNLGFPFSVVSDATATFERTGFDGRQWTAQEMHDSALASLNDEFATIATTKDVLHALR